MCESTKGSVNVADISRRMEQVIHSSSALPPAPRVAQLQGFLSVLRENSSKGLGVDPRSGTILKQFGTILFPLPVTTSLLKTELVQSGSYPTEARVRSSFAACGAHSALGSLLQWFSEAIVMLFTNGLESVASFPEEWEARLEQERACMSPLHKYIFELQGFGILFSYLWCRLAAVVSLYQGTANAQTSEDMVGLPFQHEDINCALFSSEQAVHDRSISLHQEAQNVGRASHVPRTSTQFPGMHTHMKNKASNRADVVFPSITTSPEKRGTAEGISSALEVKLEAIGRSPGIAVPHIPDHLHDNSLKNPHSLLSRGSHVNRARGATDSSNVVQPTAPSMNLSESLTKGYTFSMFSQNKNPALMLGISPFTKRCTNLSDLGRGIMKTRAHGHGRMQLPNSEDAPIVLASHRCPLLPPKSGINECRSASSFPKPNSTQVQTFRLDDRDLNSVITPAIDSVVVRKQREVRAISIQEFEQQDREKALKKLYCVNKIKNYAHERDAKDYMRHLDELRDSMGGKDTNNIEMASS